MKQGTSTSEGLMSFKGWLILEDRGGMRLTRKEANLAIGERALYISVVVPRSIFRVPALKATITIPSNMAAPIISTETVVGIEEALKVGTGMSFSVTVENP